MAYTLSTVESPELARARAAAYGLIAYGFQYPKRDTISALVDPARWKEWPDVLQKAGAQTQEWLCSVRDAAAALAHASDDDSWRELPERYDELFGHAVRGTCPAFEMEYGRNEIIRQASDLADLAGFYRAFGLEMASESHSRPDHIAAECEFMSALCAKEAYACAEGDEKNAQICLDAERTFLRDHLARWLPAFARHVTEADADGLFAALARFADSFVKTECSHFDIHAGPPTLELRTPDPVLDTEISCASGGCGAGQTGEPLVQLGVNTGNTPSR